VSGSHDVTAAGDARSAMVGADAKAWGAVGSGTGGAAEVAARGGGTPRELPVPNSLGRREAMRGWSRERGGGRAINAEREGFSHL
jgi:hypothetical protein